MSAGAVATAVLPLVGVALGTVGTMTGQYLASRGEARRQRAQRDGERRAERKTAIVDFMAAAQRVEQYLDALRHSRAVPDGPVDDRVHELWLAKKVIELVCGFELAGAAHRYTSVLSRASRSADPRASATEQKAARGEFMEAARRDLGVTELRLYATSGRVH